MRKSLVCLLLLMTLAACGAGGGNGNNTATPESATPAAYLTVPPGATSTIIPAVMTVALPTPTVFTYVVVKGDTLSGIAQRNGVTLEALLAANPGVQPTALPVGTKLVIPSGSAAPGEALPTPAALPLNQARCWPEASGGSWCFALLQNDYAGTLENLSVQFTRLDPNGQDLATQTAFALLDILPPGKAMPIAAHFPPPARTGASVRVQALTAIRLLEGDTRYLPVLLENTLVSVDASGRTAQASGRLVLTGAGTANTLWVLAAAYDAAGNVVGLRRWESASALAGGTPLSFDFQVSSVGPAIERVEFLAEARP